MIAIRLLGDDLLLSGISCLFPLSCALPIRLLNYAAPSNHQWLAATLLVRSDQSAHAGSADVFVFSDNGGRLKDKILSWVEKEVKSGDPATANESIEAERPADLRFFENWFDMRPWSDLKFEHFPLTPLLSAVAAGHENTVKLLVNWGGAQIDGRPSVFGMGGVNGSGGPSRMPVQSSLHVAAEHGHLQIVRVRISEGADVFFETEEGGDTSPHSSKVSPAGIRWPAAGKCLALHFLRERRFMVSSFASSRLFTRLAVQLSDVKVPVGDPEVYELENSSAIPEYVTRPDEFGATPLHLATEVHTHADVEMLRFLADWAAPLTLRGPSYIDPRDKDGRTPLMWAVRRLLRVRLRDRDWEADLKCGKRAECYYPVMAAKFLIERGADLHARAKDGETPFSVIMRDKADLLDDSLPGLILLQEYVRSNPHAGIGAADPEELQLGREQKEQHLTICPVVQKHF
uniref:Uncharacterized protein n=1 Tax=Chromera velia CCMP2878 TaxID=1169474 RepID=A0A0G4I8Z9_9ALVE|eukprot:Cvel_12075.t1-p1 / transcript=Cvel_12075.t1 / gene=Cvel_12075 / organism=Chromera_velia_CCMP2878 / gene_product=hypothetical protein / transcript_product=hypothetical protein / location=Cvel_scaffold777:12059-13514(+) / protein_length=458 / sequence_SO=supercontig / SO=protein_coding / is_pseudo=false